MLADPARSFWLRDALTQALACDPVDTLADAEHLVAVLRARLDALMGTSTAAVAPSPTAD